jgi:NAD(P)-dependent dehydrogenase (short-subunit alcohol dehydrogenase family)
MTGANCGIGREISHQLAVRDIHVVVTARDVDQAHQTAAEFTKRSHAASSAHLDVAVPGAADAVVERILAEHGRIDILVNNAGYGRIVNMSSTLGSLHHMDRPTEPAYRVSKTALNAFTRVLAADLVGTGILVNSASPGWVRTDLGGPNAPRTIQEGADTVRNWVVSRLELGDQARSGREQPQVDDGFRGVAAIDGNSAEYRPRALAFRGQRVAGGGNGGRGCQVEPVDGCQERTGVGLQRCGESRSGQQRIDEVGIDPDCETIALIDSFVVLDPQHPR